MTKLQEVRNVLIQLLLEEYAELKAQKLYNHKQTEVKEEKAKCEEL
jgi:hypothetical protein